MVEINNIDEKFSAEYKQELWEDLLSSLPDRFQNQSAQSQIQHAYDFAYEAHKGTCRKGGKKEPYIIHPVAVALIVANEIGLGTSSVVSALLHDVVEDTEYTREDIADVFGEDVARIVEGLTKITNVYNAKQNAQAETFKKMLLSIPQDFRVAFIKIADRLHNMRTMDDMPDGQRQIKAGENLFVYVPIAFQLGLFDIKNELEDLSFKYTHPQKYEEMQQIIAASSAQRNDVLMKFRNNLVSMLSTIRKTEIKFVTKSVYQTWSKMQEFGKSFEEINNYKSVRVIFDHNSDISELDLGAIHYKIYSAIVQKYVENQNFHKDYLLHPKTNGFKAYVFQVMFQGYWIEVQIMTKDNDMIAHKGYTMLNPNRPGSNELKRIVGKLDPEEDALELLKRFQTLSQTNTVYAFTPKGDIKELPMGSTVLDFAFAVDSSLGEHCLGGNVNGTLQGPEYKIQTTDKIEIITSPKRNPSPEWLEFVVSDNARVWLSRYFKLHFEKLGKAGDIKDLGNQKFNEILSKNKILPSVRMISQILQYYKCPSNEVFFEKLANNLINENELVELINKFRKLTPRSQKAVINLLDVDYKKPIYIDEKVNYVAAPCCYPIPGDDCICYNDSENILFVHQKECPNAKQILATQGKKTTRVVWGERADSALACIYIEGEDTSDVYMTIAKLFQDIHNSEDSNPETSRSGQRTKLKGIQLASENGLFFGNLIFNIPSVNKLNFCIMKIKSMPFVHKVMRISPPEISIERKKQN